MISEGSEPIFTDKDVEQVKLALAHINAAIGQIVEVMDSCPYTDASQRTSAIMGMMGLFSPSEYRMTAAVALDQLSRIHGSANAMLYDVPNTEEFLVKLMTGLRQTPSWEIQTDRDHKIRSMAKSVYAACQADQTAMLLAIAMLKLIESGEVTGMEPDPDEL
jgi:hypothetical protein